MRSFGDPDTAAAQGGRPAGFRLGLRLGRNRQDAGADRPAAVADARRHRSRAHPVPDLYPRCCRRDGKPAQRGAGQLGDVAGRAHSPRTLQKLTGRMPERRDDRPGAAALRARSRHPGRHQDRDDPRLLPNAVAPLPAGGGSAARICRARRAQRARSADRGRRACRHRRARRKRARARRGARGGRRAMLPRNALAC